MSDPLKRGFTLIELLVVIAIVAVLAVTVILTLNPAELLRQSRDATRFSDMTSLNKAMSLYSVQTSSPNFGTSSLTFLSLPTGHSRCGAYNCLASEPNLSLLDGTGWVPVNLASLGSLTPLSTLPVDPVNDAGSSPGSAYTYVYQPISGGTWMFGMLPESQKNRQNGFLIGLGYIRYFPSPSSLGD